MEEKRARAEAVLREILVRMDLDVQVSSHVRDDRIVLDVTGEEAALAIGRQGQTLDALELLVARTVNRPSDAVSAVIVVDSDGYRARREETLIAMARRLAAKARDTRCPVAVEGLNAAERRVVHMALRDEAGVQTHSEGEDPDRRLMIEPASASSQDGTAPGRS
jgi:spoIIIJ-associated protein